MKILHISYERTDWSDRLHEEAEERGHSFYRSYATKTELAKGKWSSRKSYKRRIESAMSTKFLQDHIDLISLVPDPTCPIYIPKKLHSKVVVWGAPCKLRPLWKMAKGLAPLFWLLHRLTYKQHRLRIQTGFGMMMGSFWDQIQTFITWGQLPAPKNTYYQSRGFSPANP